MTRDYRNKYVAKYGEAAFKAYRKRENEKAVSTPRGRTIKALSSKRSKCKRDGTPFDLTLDWYEARLKLGCELTGLPFGETLGGLTNYSPTVDRIDPKDGYLMSNCRLILHGVNVLKLNGSDFHMYRIAYHLLRGNKAFDVKWLLKEVA